MVLVTMETCHHHPGQNGNPSDDFELQSAEAARSGGDLVFSVPLKGCEVINTFTFFDIIVTFTFFHIIVTFFDIIITFTFFDIIITSFIITLVFSVPIKCYDQHLYHHLHLMSPDFLPTWGFAIFTCPLFCNKLHWWWMKIEGVRLHVIAIVKERLAEDGTSMEIEQQKRGG